ncbi:MAG: hypothetical protein WCX31_21915 [Salinivirgaceae bacterium]|jgi:hypothetical protein
MNIEYLENNLLNVKDEKYLTVINFIIDAIRDYPEYELNDTAKYFNEVRKILGTNEITSITLKDYIDKNANDDNENNIWIVSSLTSLFEAFDFMNLNKISFENVLKEINSL